MSGEFYIDAEGLKKLGKSFETRSYDLISFVKTFRKETDAEVIHDGFGILTESEEVTSAYIDLSNDMVEALNKLGRHLDDVGEALKRNAENSEEADDALSGMFKEGSR